MQTSALNPSAAWSSPSEKPTDPERPYGKNTIDAVPALTGPQTFPVMLGDSDGDCSIDTALNLEVAELDVGCGGFDGRYRSERGDTE